jgi:hypothetical protein
MEMERTAMLRASSACRGERMGDEFGSARRLCTCLHALLLVVFLASACVNLDRPWVLDHLSTGGGSGADTGQVGEGGGGGSGGNTGRRGTGGGVADGESFGDALAAGGTAGTSVRIAGTGGSTEPIIDCTADLTILNVRFVP